MTTKPNEKSQDELTNRASAREEWRVEKPFKVENALGWACLITDGEGYAIVEARGETDIEAEQLATRICEAVNQKARWIEGRKLGRHEAYNILEEMCAETFADDYTVTRSIGDTGDYSIEWDFKKLQALFDICADESLVERLQSGLWDEIGNREDAEHQLEKAQRENQNLRAQLAEKADSDEAIDFLAVCSKGKDDEIFQLKKQFDECVASTTNVAGVYKNEIARLGDELNQTRQQLSEAQAAKVKAWTITGETSDGYHTFDELYEFRKLYNAALFNEWARSSKYPICKSWKHSDGELCFGGGWFIVQAVLPTGQISNHYKTTDWELFKVNERETGYPYDGHTAKDVMTRLQQLLQNEKGQ